MKTYYSIISLIQQSVLLFNSTWLCDAFYNGRNLATRHGDQLMYHKLLLLQRGGSQEIETKTTKKKSKARSKKKIKSKSIIGKDSKEIIDEESDKHSQSTLDTENNVIKAQSQNDDDDIPVLIIDAAIGSLGGIEKLANDSSLVSHYFIRQNSYLYSIQCLCSFLVITSAIGSFYTKNIVAAMLLTRRLLIFAGIKYILSLIACGISMGSEIEKIGLNETRIKVRELLITGQRKIQRQSCGGISARCLVYCIILLLWLPSHDDSEIGTIILETPLLRHLVVAPLVLREVANVVFIGGDLIELLGKNSTTKKTNNRDSCRKVFISNQIAKIGVVAELLVGCSIILDQIKSFHAIFLLGNHNKNKRISLTDFLRVAICTRMYYLFMVDKTEKPQTLKANIENKSKSANRATKEKKFK